MYLKRTYMTTALVLASLWSAGCATKSYVRQQVQPVNTRVEAVSQQSQKAAADLRTDLSQTNQNLQQTNTKLDATTETANSADNRSTDALNQTRDNQTKLTNLNNTIANLEDYKVNTQAVVHFAFNKDTLSKDDKSDLDSLAQTATGLSRFFITVQGYTDQTGPAGYNNDLSRRRADSVIEYLVAEHNIPVYRIHMVGLGENGLINNGKTRDDRAQSRRVQVVVYSAPPLPATSTSPQQ